MRSGVPVTPLLLLAFLVAASLANGVAWPIAGRNVRPEHLAALLAFGAFIVAQFSRGETVMRADLFSALAVAWVGVNALSSWLYAPQASVSFVHVFRIGLLALVFLTVANLPLRRASDWMRGFRIWLSLGLLVLTYGLLVWIVASYLDIWMPGAFYEAIVGGPGIQSTQLEICLKAMTLGFLVMLIAYQVTDGTWLAVFWIHTGLMVNGIYCVREEQRRAAEPGQGQAS